MKNFFLIFIALFILSCNNTENKIKVAFLSDNFVVPRWQNEKDFFVQHANELGLEVLLGDAESNADKQFKEAKKLINQGAKVLVIIASNVNSAAAIVRYAHQNGVKVISYDRLIQNSNPDVYLSFDSRKVGKQMADYISKKVTSGNYVILDGDKADDNAIAIHTGVMDVLSKNKSINIIYSGYMESWSAKEAVFYMNKILQLSAEDIDAVICAYDGMASAIIPVLKKYYPNKKILLSGQDGELAACAHIYTGEQTITMYKPGKLLANTAAELALNLATGKNINITKQIYNGRSKVSSILLDPILVDKNNLEETVIKDKTYTWEQIKKYSD